MLKRTNFSDDLCSLVPLYGLESVVDTVLIDGDEATFFVFCGQAINGVDAHTVFVVTVAVFLVATFGYPVF